MRSDQASALAANWAAPNSATVGLNRPFAGTGGQTITVNLVEPGTLYGDRVNQIDLRFAKILRFGRTRTNVGFDIYNIDELGAGADLQPGVHRHLAETNQRARAALRAAQRDGRFLRSVRRLAAREEGLKWGDEARAEKPAAGPTRSRRRA